ncbi:GAF domain-containing protein [Olivibacter domesticus]|nr:GAF domain-containing protein [Olivibacter domesticus]
MSKSKDLSENKKPLTDEQYRKLFARIDQGFALIEKISTPVGVQSNYRYLAVNAAFEKHTGLRDVEGKTILELVPEAEERILNYYDSVVAEGQQIAFEDHIKSMDMWMAADVIPTEDSERIIVLFTNITERKRVEKILRENEQRKGFFLRLTDALRPFDNPATIQELVTKQAMDFFQADRCYYCEIEHGNAIIRRDASVQYLPSVAGIYPLYSMPLFDTVIRAGRPLIVNDIEKSTIIDANVHALCLQLKVISFIDVPVIKNGTAVGLLCVVQSKPREWTHFETTIAEELAERAWAAVTRAKSEEMARIAEERLRSLNEAFLTTVNGSPLVESLQILTEIISRETSGEARSSFHLFNEDNTRLITVRAVGNMPDAFANWMDSIDADSYPLTCGHIDAKGASKLASDITLEPLWLPHLDMAKAYDIRSYWCFGLNWANTTLGILALYFSRNQQASPGYLTLATAITQAASIIISRHMDIRKRILAEEKYRTLFDSIDQGFCIVEVIFNRNNEALDYRFVEANPAFYKQTGLENAVGKTMRELAPDHEAFWFETYGKIALTGIPGRFEHTAESLESWYDVYAFRIGEARERKVAIIFNDIKDRINSEEAERLRNYILLEQSEQIALLGSWEYDLLQSVFIWSDGMYKLFNLEKGIAIEPEIYLKYATKECRAKAEHLVRLIKSGASDFDERIELKIGTQLKILHLKARIIYNQQGHPVKVLGVDRDITATFLAEEKIRKMEADQQLEIFRQTLNAQEEERRRISESLHNGLGQMLYGIKLSVGNLTINDALRSPENYAEAKKYTDRLLMEGIRESRRISHELMPTMLEDFGLEAAVDDICKQLTNGTLFHCVYENLNRRLPKYMELAVYRTIQELMLNIVKHSEASSATVSIVNNNKEIIIEVKDNGVGMQAANYAKQGIGLASIKNKVKLLNGKVRIDSTPQRGTLVRVVMPYQ